MRTASGVVGTDTAAFSPLVCFLRARRSLPESTLVDDKGLPTCDDEQGKEVLQRLADPETIMA